MSHLRGRRVAVVLSMAAIAAAGCGSSSSKSKPPGPAGSNPPTRSTSTPATPSTPSTTSTTAASGPLTKASLTAAQHAYALATAPWQAALKATGNNGKTIAAATAKQVTVTQSYIAQVSALKAPSAAAAAAQQKYVSLLKQAVPLLEQVEKAASANDQTALNAAGAKLKANGAPLNAAYMELIAALPS